MQSVRVDKIANDPFKYLENTNYGYIYYSKFTCAKPAHATPDAPVAPTATATRICDARRYRNNARTDVTEREGWGVTMVLDERSVGDLCLAHGRANAYETANERSNETNGARSAITTRCTAARSRTRLKQRQSHARPRIECCWPAGCWIRCCTEVDETIIVTFVIICYIVCCAFGRVRVVDASLPAPIRRPIYTQTETHPALPT